MGHRRSTHAAILSVSHLAIIFFVVVYSVLNDCVYFSEYAIGQCQCTGPSSYRTIIVGYIYRHESRECCVVYSIYYAAHYRGAWPVQSCVQHMLFCLLPRIVDVYCIVYITYYMVYYRRE